MTADPTTAEPLDWADETEQRVLAAALGLAPSLGWNQRLVARAGAAVGLSAGETDLLLPNGPRDLAALFARRCDAAATNALSGTDPAGLKIRERIRAAVEAQLDAVALEGEAAKRWTAFLALPQNAPLGLRLAWESADRIWRWAGDTATDENHYTKRAILAGILVATTALRLNVGREAASTHLAARIDNVMAFEKWKASRQPSRLGRNLAGMLGRLRYGEGGGGDLSPAAAGD